VDEGTTELDITVVANGSVPEGSVQFTVIDINGSTSGTIAYIGPVINVVAIRK
jgi:hypothetical protein